ncbi:PREDICTED: protein anon-73B1 [Bactrocera latifrons]|uniref:protein anon-73B1 n=1 Tax=Bactrocera latifrons TaxID=174628 RepID=UPI0008DCB5FF|nr:PREDICTED: protein anon-73B1 [Bactrocera latifrons]
MGALFENGLRLDRYNSDDLFNALLRYGLFVGAIFQLICIAASILLPAASEGSNGEDGSEDYKFNSEMGNMRRLHKLRKQDKKKRR